MEIDWIEVCRMLGHDGHEMARISARLDGSDDVPIKTASLVLLKLRDALAFSMSEEDRDKAFDEPSIMKAKP